jgi:hypothetical protein
MLKWKKSRKHSANPNPSVRKRSKQSPLRTLLGHVRFMLWRPIDGPLLCPGPRELHPTSLLSPLAPRNAATTATRVLTPPVIRRRWRTLARCRGTGSNRCSRRATATSRGSKRPCSRTSTPAARSPPSLEPRTDQTEREFYPCFLSSDAIGLGCFHRYSLESDLFFD